MVYPSSTGSQRFQFALDGYDSYATWAAGPGTIILLVNFTFPFRPRLRPENAVNTLPASFRAHIGARMAQDGRTAPVRSLYTFGFRGR